MESDGAANGIVTSPDGRMGVLAMELRIDSSDDNGWIVRPLTPNLSCCTVLSLLTEGGVMCPGEFWSGDMNYIFLKMLMSTLYDKAVEISNNKCIISKRYQTKKTSAEIFHS
jgi:hypothetical protein